MPATQGGAEKEKMADLAPYPTDADGFVVYENGRRGWAENYQFIGQPDDVTPAPVVVGSGRVTPAPFMSASGRAKALADIDAVARACGWV